MNEQNAIKDIRENICTGKGSSILCRDECMYGERRCAYQLAMQALEKQVPKKVRNPIRRGAYSDCPVCGIELEMPWVYCYKCGQKVDWTVEV